MYIDTTEFKAKLIRTESVPIVNNISGIIRQTRTVYIPTMMEYIENDSSFCIISAPGATGKSALCDFLAQETGGILWDLSNASIGMSFVLGTLTKSHGHDKLINILDNIKQGKYTLILDALDEAEIVSGWNNIQIMLDEIIELFVSPRKNQVIIVSRNDTAEYVADYLSSKKIKCSRAWVRYFNDIQKKEFCKEYLKSCTKESSKQGYIDAIENIISQVDKIYNSATQSSRNTSYIDFTGYAPVLQAITQFVVEYDNPSKALRDFKTGTAISCIKKILHGILKREQEKFCDSFIARTKGVLSLSREELYSPEEQMKYILEKYKSGYTPNITPPTNLPPEFASEYVNTVNQFFNEHPFFCDGKFSGAAFRDYVLVKSVLTQDTTNLECISINVLRGPNRTFSPLLWEFYKDEEKKIRRDMVGCIMESIISAGTKDTSISFSIYGSSEKGSLVFEIIQKDKDDGKPQQYLIENGIAPIVLGAKLNHFDCNITSDVLIDSKGETVCLGDTYLACGNLSINADRIDVLPSQGEKSVLLARSCSSCVKNISGMGLETYWENGNIYPWSISFCSDYAQQGDSLTQKDWMKYLRAILRRFKKDGRSNFGKYKSQVDNVVVGNHKEKKLIVDFLKAEGIMTEQQRPPEYIISVNAFNSFGLSFDTLLRAEEPTVNSEKLYKKFMAYKHNC